MSELSSPTNIISFQINKRKLIGSGVFHIRAEDKVSFSIDNLRYEFIFENNGGTSSFSGAVVDDVMRITFLNHANSLGEGAFEPIEMSVGESSRILMTYYTSYLTGGARRFEYAFYLERTE